MLKKHGFWWRNDEGQLISAEHFPDKDEAEEVLKIVNTRRNKVPSLLRSFYFGHVLVSPKGKDNFYVLVNGGARVTVKLPTVERKPSRTDNKNVFHFIPYSFRGEGWCDATVASDL